MTTEDDMRFGYPYLLILVLLVPVVGLVGAYLRARGEKALTRLTANPPKSTFSSVQAALCRGDRDLVVAFQTHPGRQAFISSGSKEPTLLSNRDEIGRLQADRAGAGGGWLGAP